MAGWHTYQGRRIPWGQKGSGTYSVIHRWHCYDTLTHKVASRANAPRISLEAGPTGDSTILTASRWAELYRSKWDNQERLNASPLQIWEHEEADLSTAPRSSGWWCQCSSWRPTWLDAFHINVSREIEVKNGQGRTMDFTINAVPLRCPTRTWIALTHQEDQRRKVNLRKSPP